MQIKTWDDIQKFDDIISLEERGLLIGLEIEATTRCPYLKREGVFFYYCGANMPEVTDRKPTPSHPLFQRHVSLAQMRAYCTGNFERCGIYSGDREI